MSRPPDPAKPQLGDLRDKTKPSAHLLLISVLGTKIKTIRWTNHRGTGD
jgi:hypothetical protein